jgi:uroporphyrinogen decarboxylase
MGLDILDAVQPEPVGMDPAQLKADFGDKLAYCGTISTQQTLPHCSVEECRAEARHRIEVMGKGGGFILSSGCTVPANCRYENFKAMIDAAKDYWPH